MGVRHGLRAAFLCGRAARRLDVGEVAAARAAFEAILALYPGDLCPAVTHLRRMWCTAYDLFPLDVRRLKPELMGAAADQNWWVLWDHDPAIAVSRLERHKTREFVVCDARAQL